MKIVGAIFGAELIGFETGMETLRGTRYRQRMMNVDIDGLEYICGDGSCCNVGVLGHSCPCGDTILGSGDWKSMDLAGGVSNFTCDSSV